MDQAPRRLLLHVLVGPPGAGKSRFAAARFPAEWVVCADDIRERLTKWRRDDPINTWKYVEPVKAEVSKGISKALEDRLRARLPTVYDNTNLLKRNRESLLKLVPKDVAVRYYVIDRPLAAKLAVRDWRPPRLVEQQHVQFQEELPEILRGDGYDFVSVEDLRERAPVP